MKAFVINRYSKEEKLQLAEVADPVVGAHQVLVQIHAAGVNQLDLKLKSGAFKLIYRYQFPLILGHEVAGVVTKVGVGVNHFKIGDEVYSRPGDWHIGGFAEYISIHEDDVALKPKNLTMAEAASVPLVGLTAWQAFVERADLQKGQKVFIQAGSGGVGTIAIQLAKYLGASVATTTSAANFDLVKSLGADVVIDYKSDDFETTLKDFDVVLNSQDPKTLEKSLRILKPGGKLISLTGPPDPAFARETGLNWMLRPIISLISLKVRNMAKHRQVGYSFLVMSANGSQLSKIGKLIEQGILHPVVDKVFPFEAANEALSYVAAGHARGKVVISVR